MATDQSIWRAIGALPEVVATLKRFPSDPSGGIYVIEFDSGVAKIGCAGDPATRIANVARGVEIYGGWKVVRVAVSDGCTNQHQVEAALHRHFASVKVEGEIFRVSIEDVAPVLATLELLDETDRREGAKDKLINAVKGMWDSINEAEEAAHDEYAEFGESADVIREDDELLEHMSGLLLSLTVYSRKLALDVADAMDEKPTIDEKCKIHERLSAAISKAVFAELGPRSAIVILERDDGYRELEMVQDPLAFGDDDPRGPIVSIIRTNPATPSAV